MPETNANTQSLMILRDYQIDCEKAIEAAGAGKYLIAMATGLGKTAIFTHMENPGRTLILSHRDELVRQPERYYKGRKTFGVEKAQEHAGNEDVVSASVQSLQQDARLHSYAKDAFDTIIVDEAHHAAAETYRKILDYFSGARRVIGFTATPKRGDGIGLDKIFSKIIFMRDIRWGIEHGYLSRIRCHQVYSNYSLGDVSITAGDYSASGVESAFTDKNVDTIPIAAKTYMEECYQKGRHTLIYCVTRNLCSLLSETIRNMLPDDKKETIQVVTGTTPDEERSKILSGFQIGKVRGIINCMVFTEGTDLPICDAILNLRPTKNMSLYQQMVGRGTRLYEGKEYCLILDVVPDGEEIHRTLCTAPTLFGIDPAHLDQKTKERLNENEDLLTLCNSLSEVFASEAQKIDLQSRMVNLFIEETDAMIEQAEESGIKSLASQFIETEEKKREEDTDIDFGNIDVHVQADENRRYRITPTWEEEIFVSKPDILNMVHVEFHLDGGKSFGKDMSVDQVVELIRKYCETREWYYGYTWNKDLQKIWMNTASTDAQQRKINTIYQKCNVPCSDVKKLNKLEASRLIDLSNRLKNAKKLAEALSLYNSPKKTKKVQNARELVDQSFKAIASGPENESAYNQFLKELNIEYNLYLEKERAEKEREEREKARRKQIEKEGGTIEITIYADTPKKASASEKQTAYLENLVAGATKNGCTFGGPMPKNLTMRQASSCIDLLRRMAQDPWMHDMDFGNIWEACRLIETAENHKITFRYNVRKE